MDTALSLKYRDFFGKYPEHYSANIVCRGSSLPTVNISCAGGLKYSQRTKSLSFNRKVYNTSRRLRAAEGAPRWPPTNLGPMVKRSYGCGLPGVTGGGGTGPGKFETRTAFLA